MMNLVLSFLQIIITALCSVVASAGFWTYLSKKRDDKDDKKKILIGLAHDRIISLGEVYLEQGYITADEYENLYDYLYTPYKELGGNGTAKKIMDEVKRLPTKTGEIHDDI